MMEQSLPISEENQRTAIKGATPVAQAYKTECEKSARRKYVRQLASHLSMALCIDPHAQSLVITLSDGNASNNFEALKCWIDKKLTVKTATEIAAFWEGELAKVLEDVVWSA